MSENPIPQGDVVVVNCGAAGGSVATTHDQIPAVLDQHASDNAVAEAQSLREHQARLRTQREAAAAAHQQSQHADAMRTAALIELRHRAQTNPDLALIAEVLGIPI